MFNRAQHMGIHGVTMVVLMLYHAGERAEFRQVTAEHTMLVHGQQGRVDFARRAQDGRAFHGYGAANDLAVQ